ncbi:hypothetical protein [Microbacterium candidum]|uniref:Uncharacterized protein n=1 Tax=Microbacterium candidum TaxID=3041922 RepID=A0ABT7MVH3_9MICO|nr:hypothetical protein [Microbacterium sp. ASV49]MDL9978454.1 hypothetical protein [Microbacterium sp. ASV49]
MPDGAEDEEAEIVIRDDVAGEFAVARGDVHIVGGLEPAEDGRRGDSRYGKRDEKPIGWVTWPPSAWSRYGETGRTLIVDQAPGTAVVAET